MTEENNDPLTGPADEPGAVADRERRKGLAELERTIARGMDVEAFMRTDMGKYIRSRASRELEEAQDALLEADAFDAGAIRGHQLKGQVAARVLTYFADMVAEAEAAEQQHAQVYAENFGA